ncbi:MAG: hypothetical protein VX624_04105 [Pseudomonadota bacterium]|nr:hypothetical protein [Pseudomonadota bacterium]
MAKTAEQALEAAVPAIGADCSKKYRDIIHLPMHQIGAKFAGTSAPFISTEAEVPEFVDDHWDETRPDWVGSSVTLDTYREVVRDENKAAFPIEASRYAPDGSLMQTFEVILTVEKRDGDWRLISRNPFNVRMAK